MNRRELALRVFHLVGSGRRCSFSPSILRASGVAVVRSLYKSGRRGLGFFPPAPAQKSSCVLPFLLLPSSPLPPRKRPTSPKAMAGDDAWPPSNVTRSALDARVKAGILRPLTDIELPEWIVPSTNDREPNLQPGYVVCFLSFLDWGFGTPAGRLIWVILHYYEVELHNLNPNLVMQAAVFASVCEGFLGVPPHWNLWLHLFKADMAARYEGGEISPTGRRLHAAAPPAAIFSIYLEHDAYVEPGVAEWMVLPPERWRAAPGLHQEDGDGVPPEVGVGRPFRGAEEARPASCGAREAA